MKPQIFTGQTHVLGKPIDWDEKTQGKCGGLPCIFLNGAVHSQWEFSLIDRIKILFGVPLTLVVSGQSMPPVSLEIREVFKDE